MSTDIDLPAEQSTGAATDHTLDSLFNGTLEHFADRVAVQHEEGDWTYRDLFEQAEQLARALRGIGVGPGRVVALMMSNRPEYLVADLAVIRCGAIKVPLNDMLTVADAEFILRDSAATVAITDEGQRAAALTCRDDDTADLDTVILVDGQAPDSAAAIPWSQFLQAAGPEAAGPAAAPEDLGLTLYTGGTTGRPKGVTHTQRGLAINLLSHIIEMGLADDDRLLLTSPLPHSAGFLAQAALLRGATILLRRRFDPGQVLDLIGQGAVTYTFMVPTMIYRLLDHAVGRDLSRSRLRTVLYGAAPITPQRLRQALEVFGPVLMQLYGQSEAPNFLTRLRREDHSLDPATAHRLTSCGQSVLLAEVAVVDDHGRRLPADEVGEVIARSPYLMVGYHQRPEATEATLRDGWLHTGDIGYLDSDGYLYLLDRKNDVIITGGMNVYSAEVEQLLQTCPGIAQVAVVGIPDPDWGEAVVAFLVADPSAGDVDEDLLRRRCRDALSAYKRPKAFITVADLPTTAVGKVDKKQLRRQHAS